MKPKSETPISYWKSKKEMWDYYKECDKEERIKIRSALKRLIECVEGVEFEEGEIKLKKYTLKEIVEE